MIIKLTFVLSLILSGISGDAYAQSAGGCIINQAAQAALDRQKKLIQEVSVDVGEIFNGSNSCISPDLLSVPDLSSLISDPLGLLTGAITSAIDDALNNARSQVCEAINSRINGVIGDVNSQMSSFNSGLSSELQDILSSGFEGLSF